MDAADIDRMIKEQAQTPRPKSESSRTDSPFNLRQRYRRTMFFQHVDRIPNFEFGYWHETLKLWHRQGLPENIDTEAKAYQYFGIENWQTAWVNNCSLLPTFEYKVISETDQTVTYRDEEGFTAEINKQGHKSIPHYIDFPIKDRETWDQFKHRLQPAEQRIPANWPELARAFNQRDYPLAVSFGSLIGRPRNWIGFENIAYMIYDDPELLEEIVETMCQLSLDTLTRVVKDVEFDFATGWEDICFNSGPIVGHDFMYNVVRPRYKRITDLLAKHGCHIVWTDCDGDIKPILDCFMEGGVNCAFPAEVNGGSDPIAMRKRYPELRIQGGFCKMKLAEGKQAIRDEIQRIQPEVEAGGFIPGCDHRVPADVPLENYRYYLKLKREILGAGGSPQYDESKIG